MRLAEPRALLVLKTLTGNDYVAFAVAAVAAMIRDDGLRIDGEFFAACDPVRSHLLTAGAAQNLPPMEYQHKSPADVRAAFWPFYRRFHERHYTLAAFSPFPAEYRLIAATLQEHSPDPEADRPWPFLDLASILWAQEQDPADSPLRHPSRPLHPLMEARHLAEAFYRSFGVNVLLRVMRRDPLVAASLILQDYNRKRSTPDPLVTESWERLQLALFQRRKGNS